MQAQRGAIGALHRLAQALRLQVAQPRIAARAGGASRSSRSGTSSSAAAEGVGARRSAAKSARLKSVSWPIADTTGTGEAAIARARRFVVERPQVLQRAAAAGRAAARRSGRWRRRALQHRRDLRRRGRALHRHRQDLDLEQRESPRQHAEHVAHRRAAGRGDHAEPAHVGGQGTLARGVEQAFRAAASPSAPRTHAAARLRRPPPCGPAPAGSRRAPRTASAGRARARAGHRAGRTSATGSWA